MSDVFVRYKVDSHVSFATKLALQVLGSKESQSSSGRSQYRWRVAVLALVIPGILCASVVKLARASCYKQQQPIVSDGVDDNTDSFILCALPAEATKKSSLTKVRQIPGGTIPSPVSLRPRVAQVRWQLISSAHHPRFNRLLTRRVNSSADPDGAH